MPLRQTILLLLVAISLANCGCCWRGDVKRTCCPEFVSQRAPFAVSLKSENAGIDANFDSLPNYESIKQSVLAQVAADGTVAITLDEVICLAAQNSELAEVIDQERHLLTCQASDRRQKSAIDLVLQGESLEQRNAAAGTAAELFLGLVQTSMQLELIVESEQHLSDLKSKIDAAADAGFATADGKNELEKGQLQVQKLRSQLDSVHQKLTWQLNMLINSDSEQAIVFQPIHHLDPAPLVIDVLAETTLAENNRPGIRSTEMAIAMGGNGSAAYQLLKLFDSRLGMKLTGNPVKKQFLRRQLIENIKLAEQPDSAASNRKRQASKIVELRQREAAVAAGKALLDRQTAFEKLTIIHADIARLQRRSEVLAAGKEIDSSDSYLRENQNWVEWQQAKSDRVAAAIEYEVAGVKLRQSQGLLAEACGYQLESACCNEGGTCQ